MAGILTQQTPTDTKSISPSNYTYSVLRSFYGQTRPILSPARTTPLLLSAKRSDSGCRLSIIPSLMFPHSAGGAISPKLGRRLRLSARCLYRTDVGGGNDGRAAFPGVREERRVGGTGGEGENKRGGRWPQP